MLQKKEISRSLGGLLALGILARMLIGKTAKKYEFQEVEIKLNRFDRVETYILSQMRRLRIPGAAISIIQGSRIVHQNGLGVSRPHGSPPTPHTPFLIGSLTKSFTALAVMQLVEAGKVKLDAPVKKYLPWFRVADEEASSRITIRHLLNQTSGLPTLPGMSESNWDNNRDAIEKQVRGLCKVELNIPVGKKMEYSNLNYNILGQVIAAVSGNSYEQYIQEHIYDPLEMRHSYTSRSDAENDGLAVGYRHWFSIPVPAPQMPFPRGSLPSGYLVSCTEDMSRYLIAHLKEGRYKKTRVLSRTGMRELHSGASEMVTMGISSGLYAMGWLDTKIGDYRVYLHGGNVPDFSSYAVFVPDLDLGMVILFNADPFGLPPVIGEIGENATALLTGQSPQPIRLGFIQWIMRLLPIIPLLQMFFAGLSLQKLRRSQKDAALRPKGQRVTFKHILLRVIPNLALFTGLGYLKYSGLLGYFENFMPDVALVARVSGIFAGIWAFFRVGVSLLHPQKRIK